MSTPAQHDLARGLAALVVTAAEVGHGEVEARRQVGGFLRFLDLDAAVLLREAVAAVAGLAPAEIPVAAGERQLLAALEARSWLERMSADVHGGATL
ncbi:MAG: hypothetical protein ACRYF3_15505 [Janthinobacterium lividum]